MDKHGDVEGAVREAFDDVGEMHADLVAGDRVLGVDGGDVDDATTFGEAEMVRSGFVGEAHGMVATGGDAVVVGGALGRRGRLLGGQSQGKQAKGCRNKTGCDSHDGLDGQLP